MLEVDLMRRSHCIRDLLDDRVPCKRFTVIAETRADCKLILLVAGKKSMFGIPPFQSYHLLYGSKVL